MQRQTHIPITFIFLMIQALVGQWFERRGALEEWLRSEHPGSYDRLVEQLLVRVLNEPVEEFGDALDPKHIHVIDDGDYQGTQIFLIPVDRYQPGERDYVWFSNRYGSCSGCDTLQGIREYSSEPPTEEQVEQYMSLALHMVQRMKWLAERE